MYLYILSFLNMEKEHKVEIPPEDKVPFILHSIEQCHYNVVNFLTNIHKRHLIARPLGCGLGCLLWIQHLIDILPQVL